MVYLRLIYKMNTDSVESGRYWFKMTGFEMIKMTVCNRTDI